MAVWGMMWMVERRREEQQENAERERNGRRGAVKVDEGMS